MTTLDRTALAALLLRARTDVDTGLLPSCQVAVAFERELVIDETFGAPATARYTTFSVTKALSAALAWLTLSDGTLTPATRVSEVVPEFADNGKSSVTLEHLLTHTAGFPRAPMRPEQGADRDARVQRLASWRLDWEPGTQTAYHATSAYWALVELLDRVTGQDFRDLLVARVAEPLGLPTLRLGGESDHEGVQPVTVVGAVEEGTRTLGSDVKEAGGDFLERFNEPAVRAAGVPGAGAVARAADIALFYQALLHNPGGLWDGDVLRDATGNVRNTLLDTMTNTPANRTLGLVTAGDDGRSSIRGFGKQTSPRAFGAPGVGGQVAWADPASGVSVCYLTNGIERDVIASHRRGTAISDLASQCIPHQAEH